MKRIFSKKKKPQTPDKETLFGASCSAALDNVPQALIDAYSHGHQSGCIYMSRDREEVDAIGKHVVRESRLGLTYEIVALCVAEEDEEGFVKATYYLLMVRTKRICDQ